MPSGNFSGNVKFHFDNIYFDNPLAYGPFRVVQAGDLASDRGYVCEEHKQVAHEITYAVNGKASFICNGCEMPMKRGDICLNPKGSVHEIKSLENDPIRFYYIAFDIAETDCREEQMLNEFFSKALPSVVAADSAVASAFQDIFTNMLNVDEFSSVMIADAIRKLLVWTMRSFNSKEIRVYLPETEMKKNRLLSEICSCLDSETENIKMLSGISERFGYSYSYLSGIFSSALGMSLRDYFLMRRHERECELLRQGLSVTAVSERMEYSSVHAFSRAFSQREGISPSAFATASKTNECEEDK